MPGSRLRSFAVLASLALAALAASHELIYLVAHGAGASYSTAMREGGHDRYWTSFVIVVLVVLTVLAAVAATQLLRLRRLAAAVRTGATHVQNAGFDRFLRSLGALWLKVALSTAAAYLVQENVERASIGLPLPGLGVVTGGHSIALPILVIVSLIVAAVGALVGWRREVLLARLRAAARGRASEGDVGTRPAATSDRPSSFCDRCRNGVRAPPPARPYLA